MRQIIKRKIQHVTSWYGFRKRFKLFHYGIDLRSWNDAKTRKLIAVLPEDAIFLRTTYQKRWGYSHIFKGVDSKVTLKFIHIEERQFIKGQIYNEGFAVGHTKVTPYMRKIKLGDHLHFGTFKFKKPFNPKKYFKKMGVKYE